MGPNARHSVGKFASPAAEPTLGDVAGVDKGKDASSFNACSENEMGEEAPCILLDCLCRAWCCHYRSPATAPADDCAAATGGGTSRVKCHAARGYGKGDIVRAGMIGKTEIGIIGDSTTYRIAGTMKTISRTIALVKMTLVALPVNAIAMMDLRLGESGWSW